MKKLLGAVAFLLAMYLLLSFALSYELTRVRNQFAEIVRHKDAEIFKLNKRLNACSLDYKIEREVNQTRLNNSVKFTYLTAKRGVHWTNIAFSLGIEDLSLTALEKVPEVLP